MGGFELMPSEPTSWAICGYDRTGVGRTAHEPSELHHRPGCGSSCRPLEPNGKISESSTVPLRRGRASRGGLQALAASGGTFYAKNHARSVALTPKVRLGCSNFGQA